MEFWFRFLGLGGGLDDEGSSESGFHMNPNSRGEEKTAEAGWFLGSRRTQMVFWV